MQYENIFYRTSDGLLDIEFLFVHLSETSGWRAYILSDINYTMFSRTRSTDCTIIHRLSESNNDMKQKINNFLQMTRQTTRTQQIIHYICWSKSIHNLPDMKELAKTWSEITAYYIRNGGTFDTIQPILKQRGVISM